MADVLTATQRSYNMSKIRSDKTGPELQFRNLLISSGFRDFEMQPSEIFGKPDFYFPDIKVAIFVDGCFWHGCTECYKEPKTNAKFWKTKIKKNIERDGLVNKRLKEAGIKVIRIKEHKIKNSQEEVQVFIKKQLLKYQRPKVLDLFAGAGGLSEGFVRAGCEMIGHIEMEKNSCSTLTTRMIYHELLRSGKYEEYKKYILGKITRDELINKHGLQDIRDSVICAKIGKDNYKELIKKIKSRLNNRELDIIVGGPPCQAYSCIGRARDKNNMRRDGRNFLYRYYVEFLKAFRPKIFVFENVPGLLSAGNGRYLKDMQKLMKKAGYDTAYKILNAVNFGVPQNRKRIILVGWNTASKLKHYPVFSETKRSYVVKDFLIDLPKIKSGETKDLRKFSKRNSILEEIKVSIPQLGYLLHHVSRPNNSQDLEIYRMAVLAKINGENIRYNQLPERLRTHKNDSVFLDRFKVVDALAMGSHTVVAHMAKDGHFYIHPDLNQNRSLTVREAARLQTFPDDYKFEGARSSQYRQIGNAVPPMFSEIIAKELIKYL